MINFNHLHAVLGDFAIPYCNLLSVVLRFRPGTLQNTKNCRFQKQKVTGFTSDDAVQQPKAPPEKKKAPAAADPSRKTKAHAAMAARFAVEPRDEEPWCRAGGAWSWRGRPVGTRR